nr:immunoglobulin light chain junction region [Macaca mulatta]MOW41978.1 immunoglobulin light chain junction region [Macaca mulatta]MOW44216.1 immunoglobulin light chain junction region [Macaca mulatta]MOW45253.1 immunoglobulin light chain junction region [Macaca mulatta]
CQQHNAYPPTF